MDITENKRNHKLVIRFMVSYLIILMVPLLAGILVYNEAKRIVEEDTKTANLVLLNQCKDIIDKQIIEINSMNIQVSRNPRLNTAMMIQKPLPLGFYYEIRQLRDELKAYLIGRRFVNTFFIYIKNSHRIISPEIFYDADFFFKQAFLCNNKSPGWWLSSINKYYNGFSLPATDVTLESYFNYQVIPYIQSLPVAYNTKKADGFIIALIKLDEIQKLLKRNDTNENGWYIVDKDKQLVACFPGNRQQPLKLSVIEKLGPEGFQTMYLQNEEKLVTFTTSANNGWKYVSVLPARVVMQRVNYIKQIMSLFVLFSLVGGAIIAYFLTNQNVKPLKKMIDLIKENLGGETSSERDTYKYLQGSISHLIANNHSLKETIKQHIPLIKTAFIERLFKGGFTQREEIDAISTFLGISIQSEKYLVLLANLYDYNDLTTSEMIMESSIAKVKVKSILESNINSTFIYVENQNSIAILLTFENITNEQCKVKTEKIMKQVSRKLLDIYQIRVWFSVGDIHESVLDIWLSYEEAKRVLDYRLVARPGQGIWYGKLPQPGDEYYYPLNFEERLINFAKTGQFQQIDNIFKTIYRENFLSRKLSPEMGKLLASEMKATLIKLFSQIQLIDIEARDVVNRINDSINFEEVFERLLKVYESICNAVVRQKKSHNVSLKEKILIYINQNFHQADLSLSKVALHFDLSEGYLSHFFKEQTGENFITYVENIRMNQACMLFTNKDLTIEEVAKRVGYCTAYSFRRAFKRVKGINPAVYRMEFSSETS